MPEAYCSASIQTQNNEQSIRSDINAPNPYPYYYGKGRHFRTAQTFIHFFTPMKWLKIALITCLVTLAHATFAADKEPAATPQQRAALEAITGYKTFKLGASMKDLMPRLQVNPEWAQPTMRVHGRSDHTPEGTWAGNEVSTVVCDFQQNQLMEVAVFVTLEDPSEFEKAWIEKYGPPTEHDIGTKTWKTKTLEVTLGSNYHKIDVTFVSIPLRDAVVKAEETEKAQTLVARAKKLREAKDL